MTIRIAINGFGRIGRNVLRALYENGYRDRLQVVAINDLAPPEGLAHLLRHDSIHGHLSGTVDQDAESLTVNGDRIATTARTDPASLPWHSLNIDVVLECTGRFTARDQAAAHLQAGADRVLISAPSKDADAMVVYGVNHQQLRQHHRIVSCASCTTNCLAPVVQALHHSVGIESGLMTTIHAFTHDQPVTDAWGGDAYRARAATASMIPTRTGAAGAIGRIIPELAGRLDGLAVRVPTNNVSMVDLSLIALKDTNVDDINQLLERAADASPIMGFNHEPLVSIDFNHNALSSIVDGNHTRVLGRHVKVMAWYDNEWGFSNRMLDNTLALIHAEQ
ncbi:type I glyceraldehyde-3-phosphate dehydrogenase [Marinobacter xestospongiae]|uniref:type I glyceraldehyde-3-phosphate dehydrogenase n=1 Tax=Marinobacter xestospongiae TaxID=994319 RepID=UPI0020045BE1|nr:type I glyceraldehyde-3-phosphate dehydrogenase [Marinobacter xestospongiae]MCK7565835.1 type I glyceraldehyde-3-phosphate dehydrogenase [Marinobacter xestospongiae]